MKQKLIMAAMGLCTISVNAQTADDFTYLTIKTVDFEESQELAKVQKLTFENGKLNVFVAGTVAASYPLGQLQRMFFAHEATGIEGVAADAASALQVVCKEGVLSLSAPCDAPVAVYNMAGAQVMSGAVVNGSCQMNVKALANGVYVVKAGNATAKFVK